MLYTDSPSNPLLFITNSLPYSLLGGDDGIRTHDPLLAGQVLSQLSYTPINGSLRFSVPFRSQKTSYEVFRVRVGSDLSSRAVSGKVLSALQSLTSVFGMGTGGPSAISALTLYGAPSGIRTRDPLIKSQLLYHLS